MGRPMSGAHLPDGFAGGEVPHPAPFGQQVADEHDRALHLLDGFGRAAHEEDRHQARVEAARTDDRGVELWDGLARPPDGC